MMDQGTAQTLDPELVFGAAKWLGLHPGRRLPLSGCFNFRDMGGYPTVDGRHVRWRRLFRADGLARLSYADHWTLSGLGLATVIDLRSPREIAERGCFEATGDVSYYHLPMTSTMPGDEELAAWNDPAFVAARYLTMLLEGADAVSRSLQVLAELPSYPAVFHCSAGKDRTGILAAVVLGLLGVPDEIITGDYMLSREAMVQMLAWMRQEHPDAGDALEHYTSALLSVEPESIQGFLNGVRREFGSFDGLAGALGVENLLSELRAVLLEQG
jgi:protein-tyrosine phosphatase